MQITHDDNSPVLRYVALGNTTWTHDHIDATLGDRELPNYFRGTMTRTTGEGNYVSFTFNGTAVFIYGSKRFNHGVFSDEGDPLLQPGRANPSQHQAVLYEQHDLDPAKEHTIIVTNLPSRTDRGTARDGYLDIDFVVVETAVSDKIYTTRIDDTSPNCEYVGGWGDVPPRMPARYYNTTAHITSVIDDSVTCNFSGSSVQLLGGLYDDHGNYSVSLDGQPAQEYNGTYYTFDAQVPLYTASGLEDGPHTVTLTNIEAGRFLDFDYMIVNSTTQPGTVPAVVDPDNFGQKGEGTNTGAIIGGAVGGALGMLLLVLLAWFCWRMRNKRQFEDGYMDKPPLDLTGEEIRPFRNSTTPPAEGPFGDPVHPSATTVNDPMYEPGNTSAPNLAMLSTRQPSSNHSYPPSSSDQQRSPYEHLHPANAYQSQAQDRSTTFSDAPPTSEAGTFGHLSRQPPAPSPSPITQSYKSLAAAIPFTARRPSTLASSEDQSTNYTNSRMFVPGREVDAGPLSPSSDETHEMGILPPDYHQATEPLPGQRPPGNGGI